MDFNALSTWLNRSVGVILFGVVSCNGAWAQTPELQSALRALSPGDSVWITDANGRETKARMVAVSDDSVRTAAGDQMRSFRLEDVVRVRIRQPDSLINGALIGAGAAVASGLFLCRLTEPWANCRDDVGPMLREGAEGAAIGIAVDALIRRRRIIYDAGDQPRFSAAPILSRNSAGFQMSFRY